MREFPFLGLWKSGKFVEPSWDLTQGVFLWEGQKDVRTWPKGPDDSAGPKERAELALGGHGRL